MTYPWEALTGQWTHEEQVSETRAVRVRASDDSFAHACNAVDFEVGHLIVDGLGPRYEHELGGTIKVDGCCNWGTGDKAAAHLCGAEEAGELLACFAAAYRLAGALLPGAKWRDRPTLPSWFDRTKPEYRDSPLLRACAHHGMTAEQALDALAVEYAGVLEQLQRALTFAPPAPIVLQVTPEAVESLKKGATNA